MPLKKCIVIDPGHPSYFLNGQVNWGTHSKDGLKEVEVNLKIAKLLKINLEKSGYKVYLTRKNNKVVIGNKERIILASKYKAQYILRLHCDQNQKGDTTSDGVRTFYPPIEANKIYYQSKSAASLMQKSIIAGTDLKDGGIHDDKSTHLHKGYGMLIGSQVAELLGIPISLVEMVNLSSEEDVRWIESQTNIIHLVKALKNGVDRVFDQLFP
jgi:N-acetylmuramoyl-L-alanine amidase